LSSLRVDLIGVLDLLSSLFISMRPYNEPPATVSPPSIEPDRISNEHQASLCSPVTAGNTASCIKYDGLKSNTPTFQVNVYYLLCRTMSALDLTRPANGDSVHPTDLAAAPPIPDVVAGVKKISLHDASTLQETHSPATWPAIRRRLGDTEVSYYLPSRENGVNDMWVALILA
jgi:hypothetical protein